MNPSRNGLWKEKPSAKTRYFGNVDSHSYLVAISVSKTVTGASVHNDFWQRPATPRLGFLPRYFNATGCSCFISKYPVCSTITWATELYTVDALSGALAASVSELWTRAVTPALVCVGPRALLPLHQTTHLQPPDIHLIRARMVRHRVTLQRWTILVRWDWGGANTQG